MPYTYQNELKAVHDYYVGDPLQKRKSFLITGGIGVGKTFTLARTCRLPLHIDSFDPGGTKGLTDGIEKGFIVADTQWETEDPFHPDKFAKWMTAVDRRLMIKYFDHFGTYMLDGATMWGEAVMNYQLQSKGRAGETPQRNFDYVPQKTAMVNYIKKLMSLPCDFILTGHLREIEDLISIDPKTGIERKTVEYRFYTVGQAVLTIPLLFDEIYVLTTRETSGGLEREFLTEAQGKYVARSRLKSNGKLDMIEPANIRHILRKAGKTWEDKPKLDFGEPTIEKKGGETSGPESSNSSN